MTAGVAAGLAIAATPQALAEDNIGITSGTIKTPTFSADKGLNAPKVELHLTGDVTEASFSWMGPAGKTISQSFYVTTSPGITTFKGYTNYEGVSAYPQGPSTTSFGQFVASGTWMLSDIYICGRNASCVSYYGAALAALFPSLVVTVTNPLSDVTPPVFVSGSLGDTQIRASQPLHLDATVSDDVSGAYSLSLQFSTPGYARTASSTVYFTSPVTSQQTLKMQLGIDFDRLPAGTYSLSKVVVDDRAGNSTSISDPAVISSLFGGSASFDVTK